MTIVPTSTTPAPFLQCWSLAAHSPPMKGLGQLCNHDGDGEGGWDTNPAGVDLLAAESIVVGTHLGGCRVRDLCVLIVVVGRW